jgi:hypothetical protein
MTWLATVTGNSSEVHYFAVSADRETVVTGGADETFHLGQHVLSKVSAQFLALELDYIYSFSKFQLIYYENNSILNLFTGII